MLGHIARELGQVGPRFHIVGHPGEAGLRVALAHGRDDFGHVGRIERAQQVFGALHGNRATTEGDQLLERREGVAHAAVGAMGDELERLPFEFHAFRFAHGTQTRDDLVGRQAVEVEALAARMDGFGNLLRVGGAQDEDHMGRRLFEGLQQGVEGRSRQHVDFVNDVDLF